VCAAASAGGLQGRTAHMLGPSSSSIIFALARPQQKPRLAVAACYSADVHITAAAHACAQMQPPRFAKRPIVTWIAASSSACMHVRQATDVVRWHEGVATGATVPPPPACPQCHQGAFRGWSAAEAPGIGVQTALAGLWLWGVALQHPRCMQPLGCRQAQPMCMEIMHNVAGTRPSAAARGWRPWTAPSVGIVPNAWSAQSARTSRCVSPCQSAP
jgi:hypothetical protein